MPASIVHYTNCPVCGSAALQVILRARDHTVSGESFDILECGQCTLRFTQDPPAESAIGPYYQSEDYISHTNTSKGFINNIYQAVRKRTMTAKRNLVEKATNLDKGHLLDIGSGIGTFAYEMKKEGWVVTGIEPDAGARTVGKRLYNIDLHESLHLFDLPAESFDAITLWHVLEHVHELDRYIDQVKSLLKDSGKLFIAVPNYTSYDASVYKEYWAAYDVPRHLYHFSPKAIDTLVQKHQMKVEEYKPMWYDGFYISLLSNKYKYGKPKLISACWNGLLSNKKALGDAKKCSSVIYIISKGVV